MPSIGATTGRVGRVRGYFAQRVDPLTSLFLVLPLFVVYQLGMLTQMQCGAQGCSWVGNGTDFLTANVMLLTHGSLLGYVLLTVGVAAALAVAILWARRRTRLHSRLFVPVLAESAVYASLVAPVAAWIERAAGLGVAGVSGPVGAVVAASGAGLYEELFFRATLFAGGALALRKAGLAPWLATALSAIVSSAIFSAVHHVGALGEPFTTQAFVFRLLAGVAFTVVYRMRGLAIAAWTHALYDVWVLALHG
jgi:hypothetical protein